MSALRDMIACCRIGRVGSVTGSHVERAEKELRALRDAELIVKALHRRVVSLGASGTIYFHDGEKRGSIGHLEQPLTDEARRALGETES